MGWIFQWLRSRSKDNPFGLDVRNFGVVTPGRLYRGARPEPSEIQKIADAAGVQAVVSLIPDANEALRAEQAAVLSAGLQWTNLPMSDRSAPDGETIRRWLAIVRDPSAGSVFVHCEGGRHRTGLVVACYRVAVEGVSKPEAWEEARRWGYYAALGHEPLERWFLDAFDPDEYR